MTMGKKWIIHGAASRTVKVNGKILRDDGQEMKQSDVMIAIEWEKKIKGWSRQKKIDLIEYENPEWKDLSIGWF